MGSTIAAMYAEDDIETACGRSSDETSESHGFLEGKTPLVDINTMPLRNATELRDIKCRSCQRKRFWRDVIFVSRSRGKRASSCPHDKEIGLGRSRRGGRGRNCRICCALIIAALALFGIYSIVNIVVGLGPLFWDPDFDIFFPNWGKPGQPGEGLTGFPTDFTRDILPVPCHSHNDYERRIPLYEAIHYGCTGVEADVWHFGTQGDELYVGHTTSSLTRNRTFRTLYVDPLVQLLDQQNPQTAFSNETQNGVFADAPKQTLVLLVDFKTDGEAILPYVESQLSALRNKNYLAYYNGSSVVPGPITVVGTGNAPFHLLSSNRTYRDIFFDAPLDKLTQDATYVLTGPIQNLREKRQNTGQGNTGIDPLLGASQFTSENSYYASVNFKKNIGFPWRAQLSPAQYEKIRSQIRAAHEKGLKARYWNTPHWPTGLRNHIWKTLVEEGADYLNVDDLRAASRADWRRKKDRDW